MDFIMFFLILIVPGLLGALAFSIAARLRTEIDIYTALIIDLVTFTIMITGLYFLKDICTVSELMVYFGCLSFIRRYILLSTAIAIVIGVIAGLVRRLFFWIRR